MIQDDLVISYENDQLSNKPDRWENVENRVDTDDWFQGFSQSTIRPVAYMALRDPHKAAVVAGLFCMSHDTFLPVQLIYKHYLALFCWHIQHSSFNFIFQFYLFQSNPEQKLSRLSEVFISFPLEIGSFFNQFQSGLC